MMENSTMGLYEKLAADAREKRIPYSGIFELTSRCNLQCKMCYICQHPNDRDIGAKELSAREWIRLAEEARDAGMLYLLLSGGEVFLRRDFKEIYEELSKMGLLITIYTNATLITEETAKWLGGISPLKVEVTLYGASAETYAKVTGHGDAYKRAVCGIDLLLSEGIPLELRTTVIRDNACEFDRIAEFAERRKVRFGIVNHITPRQEGDITHPEAQRLSPEDLALYEMHANEYFLEKGFISRHSQETGVPDSTESNKVNQEENDPFYCSAGKCEFWVKWDGSMVPCRLLQNTKTFPLREGFCSAWAGLKKLCSSIPSCKECNNCPVSDYCLACPARLMAETGLYDIPAPYLCETARARAKLREMEKAV